MAAMYMCMVHRGFYSKQHDLKHLQLQYACVGRRLEMLEVLWARAHTVDVKKTFAVPPFNGCTVSPFPAERLSTVRSLPFTSATREARRKKSRRGTLGARATGLFLRTVVAIGLSQALERVKMRFATSIL